MKTNIPHLILAFSLSLFGAQSASAALTFTFADGGTGVTTIAVGGDTATAGGSGGTAEADDIGFSASGTGTVRQRGFRLRFDAFDYATFASIGSGTLTNTISLTSTGITGGSPTLINGFQFDNNEFYPLVMDGLANNGDTLSAIGAPDVNGLMPVDYSAFSSLHGQTFTNSSDNYTFVFTAVPEPSSSALLLGGLGMVALLRRRA